MRLVLAFLLALSATAFAQSRTYPVVLSAPAWAPSTTYAVGAFVLGGGFDPDLTKGRPGVLYECTQGGTSASVWPTGTGADIVDGTVHWKYAWYDPCGGYACSPAAFRAVVFDFGSTNLHSWCQSASSQAAIAGRVQWPHGWLFNSWAAVSLVQCTDTQTHIALNAMLSSQGDLAWLNYLFPLAVYLEDAGAP